MGGEEERGLERVRGNNVSVVLGWMTFMWLRLRNVVPRMPQLASSGWVDWGFSVETGASTAYATLVLYQSLLRTS